MNKKFKNNNWNFTPNKKKINTFYPSENLVRVLLSSKKYLGFKINIFKKNFSALEIGCFYGNNLRFFLDNKINIYGQELNKAFVKNCKFNLKKNGYKIPEIRIGSNKNISYENKKFDLIYSINTIHYDFGEEDLNLVISEFSRVVKKKGVAIIETPSIEHLVFKMAKKINDFKFVWKYRDFRYGKKFGFINNEKKFKKMLKKEFEFVYTYKIINNYKKPLGSNIFVCRK